MNNRLRQFVSYACIGISGALLDFALFWALLHAASVHYLAANLIGTVAGISNNFFLNRHFTFRVYDRAAVRFFAFFSVGLCGLALASLLLFLGIDMLGWDVLTVKLISIVFVAIVQYQLNRQWTFADNRAARKLLS